MAGAIQDNDRGTIVGRRSFGKGLVQQEMNFDDDPEIIIAYKNTDIFYDRALEDFNNDDN